jgi:hypothetical protein
MRIGQGQTARLGMMAAVVAAASANLNKQPSAGASALTPAEYSRPNWREGGRQGEVSNKTKRGLRRRATRGRR